jgi:hypothetical protein
MTDNDNGFHAQLAKDLDDLARLATRLSKAVRSNGGAQPAATMARLLLCADKARGALRKHLDALASE